MDFPPYLHLLTLGVSNSVTGIVQNIPGTAGFFPLLICTYTHTHTHTHTLQDRFPPLLTFILTLAVSNSVTTHTHTHTHSKRDFPPYTCC